MGIGPAVAIPAAVKAAGLELDDIDLFEINEVYSKQFHDLLITYLFPHILMMTICLNPCVFRHLHLSLFIAVTNWDLTQRKSMSTEVQWP